MMLKQAEGLEDIAQDRKLSLWFCILYSPRLAPEIPDTQLLTVSAIGIQQDFSRGTLGVYV